MSNDVAQGLPLVRSCGLVKRHNGPVHLALGEIIAQVAIDPELCAGKVGCAVMALVDFVCVVELAVAVGLAMVVVRCRVRVEIAHAELWTAARLNRGGVDRPILWSTVAD